MMTLSEDMKRLYSSYYEELGFSKEEAKAQTTCEELFEKWKDARSFIGAVIEVCGKRGESSNNDNTFRSIFKGIVKDTYDFLCIVDTEAASIPRGLAKLRSQIRECSYHWYKSAHKYSQPKPNEAYIADGFLSMMDVPGLIGEKERSERKLILIIEEKYKEYKTYSYDVETGETGEYESELSKKTVKFFIEKEELYSKELDEHAKELGI